MSVEQIQSLIDTMDPKEAASTIAHILKKLFPLLDEDARLQFVMNLIGDAATDKVASLVHL